MKFCPNDDCPFLKDCGSRSTFEDHVTRCLDCGTALAWGVPAEAPAGPPARLTSLGQYAPDEASALLHLLRADGIPVFVHGEYVSGEIVAPADGALLDVQVRSVDLDEARSLMAEASQVPDDIPDFDGDADPLDDSCPECGGTEFVERERQESGWLKFLVGRRSVRCCARCGTEI